MKSNIIKGMILISAVALSSCSSTSQLATTKYSINDDDVYYTRAKAGDKVDDITYASQLNNVNTGDDDYYYYGDYASRLSRFSNYTPFDYDDDFYFTYVPYNNGFGEGLGYDPNYYNSYYGFNHNPNPLIPVNNGYAYNPYIYNPYDYGYSPFYDMGYDDFDYGGIYASYIGGGGGGGSYGSASLWQQHHNTAITNLTNPNTRGVRTTQSPGITRIAAALPGRPSVGINAVNPVRTLNVNNSTVSRQTRDNNVYRPTQQPASQPSPVSSGGGSSSAASSGGGGRPARP